MSEPEFASDAGIAAMRSAWFQREGRSAFELGRLRISLTEKCNYACSFCYNEGSPGTTRSFRLEDAEFMLKAAQPFVRTIKLTGGEPLAHRQFHGFARLCSQQAPTSVTTNGSLLLRRIESLRLLSSVTVSIQSAEPNAYGTMMGATRPLASVFADIRTAILETGVPFLINCVVTRENVGSVPALCRAAAELGVKQVNLLGMLKLSESDVSTYVPLSEVSGALREEFGEAVAHTSTRMRLRPSTSFCIDLVYQYCMVGCDVCRSDGFIRMDPSLSLSYCLASGPISVGHLVQQRQFDELRAAFKAAIGAMGGPTGTAAPIVLPRRRMAAAAR
jgi:molybdenum cofactor biosynthesis enzyme MoaA